MPTDVDVPRYLEGSRPPTRSICGQSGNGAMGISAVWAAECSNGCGTPSMRCDLTTDHTAVAKWLIKKVSVSCLLQANPPTQDGSRSTVRRAWVPVPHHHYCLFPHSHGAFSRAGLFPSIDYWPKIFTLASFTQEDTKGIWTFWEQGQGLLWRSHHPALLRLCFSKQIASFRVESLRVTSQLWRSVCTDPVRAIPSLCLFNTLSCCN